MNIGFGSIIVILIAAFLVFGPNKLPEVGRATGSAVREFKKATQNILNEKNNNEK
ncbi:MULTISPECIES: twin-arginine translocase TatA/TatE family subunit [Geomicrobium]|uniref:Sec-independent protein translocase protein TatA n=1 Tax=Geomicrobium sediminis TaxID=1347788 RepID=A0ABS2P9P8_9BACL|nr:MULTISPECIES: twin-arginine translocase TatA/TatE family subunit [Geomicrobium]MBM7632037.1 sec-independent protein translocase protein TatA [Geomicrobium sediminis]GAK01285.1 twin-arginine translocation protein TatAd [Geomicrobium sp. JCM 19055]GAK10093.1 twin-arginine translocation protein TatAd [Geomicrobium sp. JCM 19038]